MIEIIHISKQTWQGNLFDTVQNQLIRKIGKFETIFWSNDCGSVKSIRDGKSYDWHKTEGKNIEVIEAK